MKNPMAAGDDTKTDARTDPAMGADGSVGPVIDNEPTTPKQRSPFMRRVRLYGIFLLVLVVALLVAAGSYPYWRANADVQLVRIGVELGAMERRLGVPEWAITHGRSRTEPASAAVPAVSASVAAETETKAETAPEKPRASTATENASTQNVGTGAATKEAAPAPTQAAPASATPVASPPKIAAPVTAVPETVIAAPAEAVWRAASDAMESRMAALEARLSGLEGRLETVEQAASDAVAVPSDDATAAAATAPASSDPAVTVPADLDDRLKGLAKRLAGMEAQQQATAEQASDPTPNPQSAALIGTVVGLAERVATIESHPPVDPAEVAVLRDETGTNAARVAELDARLQSIESHPPVDPAEVAVLRDETGTNATRVAELDARLQAIDAKLEIGTPARDRAALVLLSVSQLAVATAGPRPYAVQLEALRAVADAQAPMAAAIDRLAAHAEMGTPTLALLKVGFATVSAAAVRSRDVGAPEGLLGQTLSRVAALVSVRRIDNPGAGTVDGALAAADAALASADLPAAVAALTPLDGAPGAAVAPWLARAQARLSVDGALSELQAAVIAVLAAAG